MEAEQLSRAVNLRLPDLNLGAEKLSQNPKFAKLLLHLADRVDLTGLSLSVKGQQEKAGGQLRNQKRDWLRSEALERVLQEMVTEHHVTRWESPASREDRQFFQTLEQSQVVAVSCRWLDTREEKEEKEEEEAQSCPPLLGLERNHLLDLLPDAREVQAMRQRLVSEVELRLREKCFAILCYYRPEYDSEGEAVNVANCGLLLELLQTDRVRQESERERVHANRTTIARETRAYIRVLYRSFELLRELIERHRLVLWPKIDQDLGDYRLVKTRAMFAKLGLMRLDVRQQLFKQDTVETHRRIREELLTELEEQQGKAKALRGKLDLYHILGSEFEELAAEYGRLREQLVNKQWGLREFSKSQA